jgi:DinB superfamily
MTGILSKKEIIQQVEIVSHELTGFCSGINELMFFRQPDSKWSIAQNVKHLITATDISRVAFLLPKFIVRLYAGKPNRSSRSYDELVAKYKLKLEQGGRASGRYIPKLISPDKGKEKMIQTFSAAMLRLASIIEKKWNDPQLDKYIAPHPLLGKITLRELCYFTIYHTEHHLNIIKSISKN